MALTTTLALVVALQAPLIDYQTSGKPVSVVLQDLAKAAGLTLEAEAPMSQAIVALRVRQKPVEVVLDQLAWATVAEWEEAKDGSRLLRRSRAVRLDENDRVEEWRTLGLAQGLQSRAQALAERPWSGAELGGLVDQYVSSGTAPLVQRNMPSLGGRSLAHRFIDEALISLAAPDLAAVDVGETVTFAMVPGRAELAFRTGMRQVFRDLQSRLRWVHDDWKEKSGLAQPPELETPDDALLIISRYAELPDLVNVTAVFLRSGRVLGTAETQITPVKPLPFMGENGEASLRLSDQGLDLLRRLSPGRNGTKPALPDATVEAFVKMSENEPLGWVVGGLCLQLADALDKDLVCRLSDASAPVMKQLLWDELTPESVWPVLSQYYGMAAEGNWLRIRPHAPFEAEAMQISRSRLGLYAQQVRQRGRNTFGIYSAVLGSPPVQAFPTIQNVILELLETDGMPNANYHAPLARVFGSFDQEQRTALLRGQALEVSRMTDEQQELIRSMLGLEFLRWASVPTDVSAERFHRPLKDGMPAKATMTLAIRREPYVFAYDATGETMGMSIQEFARYRVNPSPTFSAQTYQEGYQDVMHFLLALGPGLAATYQATDPFKQPETQPGPYTELSEALRQAVAAEEARIRDGGRDSATLKGCSRRF